MKKVLAAILVIVLIGVGAWRLRARALASYEPQRIPPNVVFHETGLFRSLRGPLQLQIWAEPNGQLKYSIELKRDEDGSLSQASSSPIATFRPNSDWIMCWDTRDRLWVYIPDHNATYCTCWNASPTGFGQMTPGELGGWDGVPEAFLARLPEPAKAVYRTGSLPAAPAATTR